MRGNLKMPTILNVEVSENARIMIIGTKPGNFPDYENNDRFVLRSSTNLKKSQGDLVPNGVEVIFFLKFISHQFSTIISTARKIGVKVFKSTKNTGEIKRIIQESGILNVPYQKPNNNGEGSGLDIHSPIFDQVEKASVVVPPPSAVSEVIEVNQQEVVENPTIVSRQNVRRGDLKAFVIQNANLEVVNQADEKRRLFNLALQAGLQTTLDSIGFTYYSLRKKEKVEKKIVKSSQNTVGVEVVRAVGEDEKVEESIGFLQRFVSDAEILSIAFREVTEKVEELRKKVSELGAEIRALQEENFGLKTKLENIRRSLFSAEL